MFRNDWSIKPSGEAYLDLLFNEWWTDEQALADADGVTTVRGFKGDYEVSVSAAGHTVSVDSTLSSGGEQLTVVLPILVGDYNSDGVVDVADYTLWRDSRGSTSSLAADGDNNGIVDDGDYQLWTSRLGSVAIVASLVPEPTGLTIIVLAGLCSFGARHRRT
jgi:hypothetical protein